VAEVCLLVEAGLVELESVDNVDLGLLLVIGLLLAALGGSVGTSVEGLTTDGDLAAVSLVGDTVNLNEVVRVGDELVTGDDVLYKSDQPDVRAQTQSAPPSLAQFGGECRDSRCRSACWRYLCGESGTSVKVVDEVVEDVGWLEGRSGKDCCLYFLLGGVFNASGAQAKRAVERAAYSSWAGPKRVVEREGAAYSSWAGPLMP
jgi:hypothetical protein